MGEAARRKKLDPNYGKVPSLSTRARKKKHSKKIFHELLKEFAPELRSLSKAKTVPENYQTITERVKLWVDNQLLSYDKSDRAYLAKYLFRPFVVANEPLSLNPLIMSCLFKAVMEYFPPDQLQCFLNNLETDDNRERLFSPTDPCKKFAYEEIAQEVRLTLAINSKL